MVYSATATRTSISQAQGSKLIPLGMLEWYKQYGSTDPSCYASTVYAAACAAVWGIISWHTLGPFVPTEHCWYATTYLSIIDDHVHPSMTSVPIF